MRNNRFKTGGIEREMKQVKETCLLALERLDGLCRGKGEKKSKEHVGKV